MAPTLIEPLVPCPRRAPASAQVFPGWKPGSKNPVALADNVYPPMVDGKPDGTGADGAAGGTAAGGQRPLSSLPTAVAESSRRSDGAPREYAPDRLANFPRGSSRAFSRLDTSQTQVTTQI